MLSEILKALEKHGVTSDRPVRVLDHDVKPGVLSDMGEGDEWPSLREQDHSGRHLRARPADLDGPALERRQAGAGAARCISRRDRRPRTHACRRQGGAGCHRRQRGRCACLPRRLLPVAQRCRLHHPGQCRPLLGRRGHGQREFRRPPGNAGEGCRHDRDGGLERRPSCRAAEGHRPIPGSKNSRRSQAKNAANFATKN